MKDDFRHWIEISSNTLPIWLLLSETPLAPSTPVVSNIQPTSVRLTWLPPGYNGNSPILSYIVEARKGSSGWQRQMDNINPSSQQVSVLVRNLQPHTQYQFRVRAKNQVGVGAPSAASKSILTDILQCQHSGEGHKFPMRLCDKYSMPLWTQFLYLCTKMEIAQQDCSLRHRKQKN